MALNVNRNAPQNSIPDSTAPSVGGTAASQAFQKHTGGDASQPDNGRNRKETAPSNDLSSVLAEGSDLSSKKSDMIEEAMADARKEIADRKKETDPQSPSPQKPREQSLSESYMSTFVDNYVSTVRYSEGLYSKAGDRSESHGQLMKKIIDNNSVQITAH
jgi:hypothetical protein